MTRVRIGRGSYRLIPAEVIEGEPRERPILFSGPMVRAILAGRKTQTRRVVTPALPESSYRPMVGGWHPTKVDRHGEEYPGTEVYGAWWNDGEDARRCPFGEPGDRLWVRETWKAWPTVGAGDLLRVEYASGGTLDVTHAGDWWLPAVVRRGGWAPSIHMPRWASRITLALTEVRVERLQDISEEDAIAEGCFDEKEHDGSLPSEVFRTLWNEINTGRKIGRNTTPSWDHNPWVWVIGFKRIEQARHAA